MKINVYNDFATGTYNFESIELKFYKASNFEHEVRLKRNEKEYIILYKNKNPEKVLNVYEHIVSGIMLDVNFVVVRDDIPYKDSIKMRATKE